MVSNLLNRKTFAYVKLITQATIFLTSAFASLMFSAVHTPSSEAQTALPREATGTCHSGRNRLPCFYPSANGFYSNVRNIQITGGSGADVLWESFTPLDWTGGWSAGPVFTIGGKMYLRSGVSACVIGFPQHHQITFCNNPYRGSQGLVRVMVRPHNANWQTNFKLTSG